MRKFIVIFSILIIIAIGFFYLKKDFPRATPTVYFNAEIITLDAQNSDAEAMYVVDGKIINIGSSEVVIALAREDAIKVDMKGAVLMPGFIDPHTHFALSMYLSVMHDLSGFKHPDNESVWNYFEEKVDATKPSDWIICKGMDPILVHDLVTPSIQYLDSIAPDNPIIIFSQSLHSYWGNTRAFEKAGVSLNTENPSEHSYYEKDFNNQFTGLIVEQEAFRPFIEVINEEVITPDLLSNAAVDVMNEYAMNGNTTIVSAGLTINDSKPLILTEHLSAEKPSLLGGALNKIGKLPSREPMPRHFVYMRHDMVHLLPESRTNRNDFYDIIGVKHWYDGSPYIGSMYMDDPYKESELTTEKLDIPANSRGEALIEPDALKEFIRSHHDKGWQISIHTQGDAAINEVVRAFSDLDSELDFGDSRHRLEHCLMLPQTTLEEMKRLNISPSFHINHLYYYGEALKSDVLGEERVVGILPIQSAVNNDMIISFHADQPMFESHPFRLIQTAIERKTNKGNIIGEYEKIDLLDAIKALTIHAAWQINMEDKIGSLEVGKYADFIILDRNPFLTPADQLENIKVNATYINGNKVSFNK
ncbi:MAG: amidohydrolase [Saprospiraceae bacterium]|nr:amidohydrolase [Saprospiraceae bacterium]